MTEPGVSTADRLFGPVMFWTIVTGIFAWLPLVRVIGRPEGYTWGILGLSGSGTEGPFWIFVPFTAFAVVMIFSAFRGPRGLFRPMLLLWHALVAGTVVAGVALGGRGATFQGQGLRFEIPLWLLSVPFVAFGVLAAVWVVLDRGSGVHPKRPRWTRANTLRLVVSLALLGVALALFRAGTNYDLMTAAAILVTVAHWIVLVQSFAHVSDGRTR